SGGLLGVGAHPHVAAGLPGLPQSHDDEAVVVGMRASPRPPPLRVTMTLPSLRRARQVWLLDSGGSKAEAVRLGVAGGDPEEAPVAGARGSERTVFWLDQEAAAQL